MGRTLHYKFKPANGKFTPKQLEKLYDVGKIWFERCKWTCEAISIRPYDVYPNWEAPQNYKCQVGWEILNKRWDELSKQNLHPNEISKLLVKEKIANFFHSRWSEDPKYGFGGFTKTGGNELNSLQVVLALTAASKVVKNAVISLHDEGRLLKCGIVIQNGLAMPDEEDIDSNISYLLGKALFDKSYKDHKEQFIELSKELYNMKERYRSNTYPPEPSYEITEFCRPINIEDFEDYPEYNAGQIMAGFEGEYFGLSSKDAESESYKMIALLQKLLPDGVKVNIASKIEKK